MEDGIWHCVIKDKYLPYTSVTTWLISAQVIQPVASHFWKSLMKSLPLITHWLRWIPGGGAMILIGLYMILGMGKLSFLSHDLLLVLRTHNILYLYQAKLQSARGFIIDQWKTNDDLGIIGHLALEWTNYMRALIGSGINQLLGEDRLLWTGGDQSGTLSTKMYILL
jgi:hypothetical protein